MIDLIEKLPDWMIGAVVAGLLWFGFNYAVLAERAMERDHVQTSVPKCLTVLEQEQHEKRLPLNGLDGIGQALGVPELGRLGRQIAEQSLPPALTALEMRRRCLCAARSAAEGVRFDYALHTASFRLVTPQSVGALREQTIQRARRAVCNPGMGGTE